MRATTADTHGSHAETETNSASYSTSAAESSIIGVCSQLVTVLLARRLFEEIKNYWIPTKKCGKSTGIIDKLIRAMYTRQEINDSVEGTSVNY